MAEVFFVRVAKFKKGEVKILKGHFLNFKIYCKKFTSDFFVPYFFEYKPPLVSSHPRLEAAQKGEKKAALV